MQEIWTARVDFSSIGKGDDDEDVEIIEIDPRGGVNVEDLAAKIAGGNPQSYDITSVSYYGGPRDTPFRFCRLYGNGEWVGEAFGPRNAVSAEGAVGIECYAIYYRGIPTSQTYEWLGQDL